MNLKRVPAYCLHKKTGQGCCEFLGKRHYFGPYDSPSARLAYGRFVRYLKLQDPSLRDARAVRGRSEQRWKICGKPLPEKEQLPFCTARGCTEFAVDGQLCEKHAAEAAKGKKLVDLDSGVPEEKCKCGKTETRVESVYGFPSEVVCAKCGKAR